MRDTSCGREPLGQAALVLSATYLLKAGFKAFLVGLFKGNVKYRGQGILVEGTLLGCLFCKGPLSFFKAFLKGGSRDI